MSLASLLNKEDRDTQVSETCGSASEAVMNGIDSSNDAVKKRFVKEMNEDFRCVSQRDRLEHGYQDWKFINFQEFELISEWNNQTKEWANRDEGFEKLYQRMGGIREEWEKYDVYKRDRLSVMQKLNLANGTSEGESAEKKAKPARSRSRKPVKPVSLPVTPPPQATVTPTRRKRQRDELDNSIDESPLKKEVEQIPRMESGRIEPNHIDEHLDVHENGEPDERQDEVESVKNDEDEDEIRLEEDEEESADEQVEPEAVEVDAPVSFDDDENDEDFSPDEDIRSITSSKKDKSVSMESERSRIVRELVKMCNKNRNVEKKKRRFTNANVLEYNPLDSKLIVKVTLKQFHVKQLKRLINESKRIAAMEEAAKNQAENPELEGLSPASKKRKLLANGGFDENSSLNSSPTKHGLPTYGLKMTAKEARAIQRHYDNTLFTILKDMARKDSAKVARLVQQIQSIRAANFRKTSSLCAREARKWQFRNFKQVKDFQTRARRGIREMSNFWKKNEREERDLKKKAEKEAMEQARKEEEARENKRQAKKLNFLLTQTELYSHFIGRKIKTNELEGNMTDHQLSPAAMMEAMTNGNGHGHIDLDSTEANKNDFHSIDFDNEDDEQLRIKAAQNASNALAETRAKTKEFDDGANGEELNFQNPTSLGEISIEQPKMLACTLKEYQLKGLNWLANLYDQGINGILADEMGLGKTVQSISVLAHLAEKYNIWGPFLVVTPASTLHNWVNEISKFVPQFKILPYWGNANDRKVLRRFWDRKNFRYGKDSPFHVMITSYQMVVSDVGYLQKMKWQYMILDEAQAIKSSQSSRWKNLLSFHCRNRLLLTGTPIQNSMQELWALLHFIMPSLFDSHDEFNEWFSRDIESHAEANTKLNQQQLRRLHMILKPFMLRRVKKNVQSELGDKIEIDVLCDLTQRQAKLYQVLKSQVSTAYDAIENAAGSDEASSDQSLINTVMQFRKVCNHPDLFERADISSPFGFVDFGQTAGYLKNDELTDVMYSTKNPIKFHLPKLIYDDVVLPNYQSNATSIMKLVNHTMSIFSPAENRKLCNTLALLTGLGPASFSKIAQETFMHRALEVSKDRSVSIEDLAMVYDETDLKNNSLSLCVPNRTKYLQNLANFATDKVLSALLNVKSTVYSDQYFNSLHPGSHPMAVATPVSIEVLGSGHMTNKVQQELFDPTISQALSDLPASTQRNMYVEKHIPVDQFPVAGLFPDPLNKLFSSNITMPSMDRFITESAKLKKLDELLVQLKKDGHRVLIYFQMTRMMDLMEEYLTYRRYKHIRLDGSSKLEDRRDLVHDWQTIPDLFVFLLSTRAGGLGINLTAADTVIFYDSDWNPTIDSQAMDRAHRLGQTRQVTVYRLLVKGTIEERMRDRAKQKEHVQQVVMEGKTQDKKVQTVEASQEEVKTKLKQ